MHVENLIQRADLNQRITRALEIKGQKSPVLTLDNSVVAVVIAEDLTQQAQWVDPTSKTLAASATITGVAAQTGILAVSNPAGSGVVAVVEKVTANTLTNMLFRFGLVNPIAVPAGLANLFFRDRRSTGAPACRAFQGTDGALQIVNEYLAFQVSNAIATPWFETPGVVIQPGETFGIQATTVNITVGMNIFLQEIPLV
jgi:hypothetical protein